MAKGVATLAVVTLVIGFTVSVLMVYTIILEGQLSSIHFQNEVPHAENVTSHHLQHAFGLHLNSASIKLIVVLVLLVSVLTVIFSSFMLLGVEKNNSSLVLSYFGFAVLLSVLLLVSGVLQLLQSCWYTAVTTFIVALMLMARLPSVYSFYEGMTREAEPLLISEEDLIDNESVDYINCA